MSGTLYLCATPIGNLGDITLRVLETLKEVDLIAAEDTRNSIKLLTHFDIHTPMTSYHEFNKIDKGRELVGELLKGKNIALITDAGTPGISDPGEELVKMAQEAGVTVTSLPGACACITALTLSGQSTRRFDFEAFLPKEKKLRQHRLQEMDRQTETVVLYEAPHHLLATLRELMEAMGDRRLTLCRELTKKHEEAMRCTFSEAIAYYENPEHPPRGEYVLVIEGRDPKQQEEQARKEWEAMDIPSHVAYYEAQGIPRKAAMKKAAEDRGVSKRDIYQALLEEKDKEKE